MMNQENLSFGVLQLKEVSCHVSWEIMLFFSRRETSMPHNERLMTTRVLGGPVLSK